MTDIFLSYAREDRARAKELADALEQQGWSVWWDRTIQAGQAFDEVIEEALEGARCIIVLWSSNSVSSRWVRSEAEEGADRKILVPVLIHEVRIPLGFKRIQAANLVDWHRSLPHAEFENLVEAISGILGPPSAAQPDLQTKPQAHIYSVRDW